MPMCRPRAPIQRIDVPLKLTVAVAPAVSSPVELTVITASVVGGVSILGGTGTVIGSTLAAILFATIGSSLVFLNVSAYWLRAVQGLLILATVLADMARRHRIK